MSDEKLIIPEYKIDLLNKSKKLINTIENVNSVIEQKKINKNFNQKLKKDNKEVVKSKERNKKTKKKKVRTLWVKKKKN